LSELSKSHIPVIPGAEPTAGSKRPADFVQKGDAAERNDRRKRLKTQLDIQDDIIKEAQPNNVEIIKSIVKQATAENTEAFKRLEVLEEVQKRHGIRMDASLKTEKEHSEAIKAFARVNLLIKRSAEELESKVTKQQESIESLKETTKTQTTLIQDLKEEVLLERKRGEDFRQRTEARIEAFVEALGGQNRNDPEPTQNKLSVLLAAEKKQKIQGLREEILQERKKGEDLRVKMDSRLDAVIERLESGKKGDDYQALRNEIAVLGAAEQKQRAHISNLETQLSLLIYNE
jgi:hypothetical protein